MLFVLMPLIFIVSILKYDLLKPAVNRDIPSFTNGTFKYIVSLVPYFPGVHAVTVRWLSISKQFSTWLVTSSHWALSSTLGFLLNRIMITSRNSGKYAVVLYVILHCIPRTDVRMKLNAPDQTIHVQEILIHAIYHTKLCNKYIAQKCQSSYSIPIDLHMYITYSHINSL